VLDQLLGQRSHVRNASLAPSGEVALGHVNMIRPCERVNVA
jgi:hypothetical protein